MKKIFIALTVLLICTICFWACKKETASMPSACFTANRVDSDKVKRYDSSLIKAYLNQEIGTPQYSIDSFYLYSKMDSIHKVKVDSIVKIYADSFFVAVTDTTNPIYKQPLFFKYCGSDSKYRVIWTGDAGHIYHDKDSVGAVQTGVEFPVTTTWFTQKYTSAGTFNVVVISSNLADYGNDIQRSVATIPIKLK